MTELLQRKRRATFAEKTAWALGKVSPKAIPALTESLKDKEEVTFEMAVADALGEIGPDAKTAIPSLIKSLKDGDSSDCWSVAEALGKRKSVRRPIPAVTELLKDKDVKVRFGAVSVLGKIGPDARRRSRLLQENLSQDKDSGVRLAAASSLWQINHGIQMGHLSYPSNYLKDKDEGVRYFAVVALYQLGPVAIPALTEALRDGSRWSARRQPKP